MILIQEEDAPKRYNLYNPGWALASCNEKEISWIWSELKVSVDAGLERPEFICSRKDRRGNRVSRISRSLRNKRIGECVCSARI